MKNLLLVAALTVAAAPAMASKARVNALGNSRQVVDVQTSFDRPYLFNSVGELATIEWGGADTHNGTARTDATRHAEGGFLKKHDDMVYGIYFGRQSDAFNTAISKSNAVLSGVLLREQNPLNLIFATKSGDLSWGATFKYSNGKLGDLKSSSMGVAAGITNGTWEVEATLGLLGKSEVNADNKVESKTNYALGFGYNLSDAMQVFAKTSATKADQTLATVSSTIYDATSTEVGFINTVVKNDDANFFYGIKYQMGEVKDDYKASRLPIWMGVEANATSWMVIRGSLTQNVLINEVTLSGTPETKVDADSIAFAAGAGLKLGKGMLDVSFGNDSKKGQFDYAAAGFLTQASYTYNF